jgi:putative FmdB family regulatory protein
MPTYEYVCRNCGHRFDVVQSIHSDPLKVCPNCGEPQLRKVFAPPAISFKGSGFYATDSKAKTGDKEKEGVGRAEKKDAKEGSTDAPKAAKSRDGGSSSSSDGNSSSPSSKNTASSKGDAS